MKPMSIESLLAVNKYEVNKEAHIHINKQRCSQCLQKPCTYVCPAGLYKYENGEMNFDYAGCLECGTCRVVCNDKTAMKWQYPRSDSGIFYRYG